jgi:hypothetical protein
MTEETITEKFERLMQKNGIMSVSRMYKQPSLDQLFNFFKDTLNESKQQKLVLPTRNQPSSGVVFSEYIPEKKKIVTKSQELTLIDQNVLKLLKNRKVRGLSGNEISSLLDISSSASYGALRKLKALDLIRIDASGRVPKCWIIKGDE